MCTVHNIIEVFRQVSFSSVSSFVSDLALNSSNETAMNERISLSQIIFVHVFSKNKPIGSEVDHGNIVNKIYSSENAMPSQIYVMWNI